MISLHAGSAVTAAFLASLVEAVEALTIVLAVSVVRGWRPAGLGAVAGLVALTAHRGCARPVADRVPLLRAAARHRHFAAAVRHALAAQGDPARGRLHSAARRGGSLRQRDSGIAGAGAPSRRSGSTGSPAVDELQGGSAGRPRSGVHRHRGERRAAARSFRSSAAAARRLRAGGAAPASWCTGRWRGCRRTR